MPRAWPLRPNSCAEQRLRPPAASPRRCASRRPPLRRSCAVRLRFARPELSRSFASRACFWSSTALSRVAFNSASACSCFCVAAASRRAARLSVSLRSASADPRIFKLRVTQHAADGRVQHAQRSLVEQPGGRFCTHPGRQPILDQLKREPDDAGTGNPMTANGILVIFIANSCVVPVLKAGRRRWSGGRRAP